MKTSLRSRLAGALLPLTACGDFTLVDPSPGGAEPGFFIHINVVSEATTRYLLSAILSRGTGGRGQLEFADKRLFVNATPILPQEQSSDALFYNWEATRTTAGTDAASLRLTFPTLATSPTNEFSVAIPIDERQGAQDIEWRRGEDLVLRILQPPGASAELSGGAEQWDLRLGQACSGGGSDIHFTLFASGPYPSELRVPSQWLEPHAGNELPGCFQAISLYEVVGSPYPASVSVAVRLSWRIRVVRPPS
jgi:hypothetical protein